MGKRLYVGNISYQASEEDLKTFFSSAGEVVATKLIKDGATGRSRGFGFVEMNTDEEAKKAIETLNGSSFLEREIVVNEAKPFSKKERSSSSRGRDNTRERR
ncbi:MAG: RNA-binding protein [Nitrospiraceae bacterium]|nr:RNA-binding protein [Nitrospiraceae bacterium]